MAATEDFAVSYVHPHFRPGYKAAPRMLLADDVRDDALIRETLSNILAKHKANEECRAFAGFSTLAAESATVVLTEDMLLDAFRKLNKPAFVGVVVSPRMAEAFRTPSVAPMIPGMDTTFAGAPLVVDPEKTETIAEVYNDLNAFRARVDSIERKSLNRRLLSVLKARVSS